MIRRVNEGDSNASQTVTRRKSFRRRNSKKTLSQVPTRNEVRSIINKSMRTMHESKTKYNFIQYNTVSGFYPTTAGRLEDLTLISQGVTPVTRTGQTVTPTSLEIRWNISSPSDTAQSHMYITRMVAFIMNTNSANVTIADIIEDITGIYALISPFANTTRAIRKVLWDYSVIFFDNPVLGTIGNLSASTSTNASLGSIYIPLNNLKPKWRPITFDDAATTGNNHIYLASFSNIAGGAQATTWSQYIYTAVNYIDA